MPKALEIFISLVKALLCDKNKEGDLTIVPSFAKIAFWIMFFKFLPDPDHFNQWWFYLSAALLAYILFGTKFLPAFFANKVGDEPVIPDPPRGSDRLASTTDG